MSLCNVLVLVEQAGVHGVQGGCVAGAPPRIFVLVVWAGVHGVHGGGHALARRACRSGCPPFLWASRPTLLL